MEYKSLFGFYWFGTCLRYLQDANNAYGAHGEGHTIYNIEQLFVHLSEMKLTVSARLAHTKLDKLLEELKKKPETSDQLTSEEAQELRKNIGVIREALEAEIEGIGAYSPTPKRLDISRLINDVSTLFSPDVFNHLPDVARFDFSEAGKCESPRVL